MVITSIVIAVFLFLIVIVVHEFGHFTLAKLSGIDVEEFSIGMGPSLFSFKSKETQYSLRAIPMGGYVSMENVSDDNPNSFNNAPVYKRMLVILAGAFMNFLLAFILFFIIGITTGNPINEVGKIAENSPAEKQLQVGDEILQINNKKTETWNKVFDNIQQSDKTVQLKIKRNEEILNISIDKAEDNTLGIYPASKISFSNSIKGAFASIALIISSLITFLSRIFTGGVSIDEVSGPVGIVSNMGEVVKMGFSYVLFFLAYINVNVGFLNLLPIPALDGAKFLSLLVEGIRKKPISQKAEMIINLVGFMLLILLIIIVTINDIIKLR